MITKETFDHELQHLANNWANGEITTDDFISYIFEYSENSPYSAFVLGMYLSKYDPVQCEIFQNILWQQANDNKV